MNGTRFSKNIFVLFLIGFLFAQNLAFSEDFYASGMSALQKNNYPLAIDYFKKALAAEPNNTTILNNLAVAYTSRGTYFYNSSNDLNLAANDYRNAVFYLEFYNKSANTPTMNQNIPVAHQNLNSVLVLQKFNLSPQNRLKKAKELRGKGEFQASIVEYSYAAKDRKLAYESYIAMGDVMKSLNSDYNAAIYYDKALAQDDSDPNLHLKFARTLYKLGNIDAAVRELDIASENTETQKEALNLLENIWKERAAKNPNNAISQMNLGVIYQKKSQYDLAMLQYRKAQNIDPKNQTLKLNIATLLQQQGEYEKALSIYNDILKIRPNDVTINTYKATTLYKMGNVEAAIIVYQNLLLTNPDNKAYKNDLLNAINESSDDVALQNLKILSEKIPSDFDIIYNYAYTLHKTKNYDDALIQYKKALALNSQHLDTYLNIASIYKHQNDLENGLSVLNSASLLFKDNKKIDEMISDIKEKQKYDLLGKASQQYSDKLYEEAIKTYSSIPNPTEEIFLGIGACYQALENYDLAIFNYQKALKIDPSNPNANYFLGLAYFYQKNYSQAEIYIKKAKELDSVNPDILDAYKSLKFAQSEELMKAGVKLYEENKFDDAITQLTKSVVTCAENGYAYYYRGLAYDAKTQHDLAINDYKKALELSPELTMAYYSLALSYDASKNVADAKKMLEKFLTENTEDNEYTQYAKQRLSEL